MELQTVTAWASYGDAPQAAQRGGGRAETLKSLSTELRLTEVACVAGGIV